MHNRVRSLAVLAGLVAASASYAQYSSPELLIAFDFGNGTAAHPEKFDRYDPISHQYLGSFGQGFIPSGSVTGIANMNGNVYISCYGGGRTAVVGYNFSTGAVDFSTAVNVSQAGGLAAADGKLYLTDVGKAQIHVIDSTDGSDSSFADPVGPGILWGVAASADKLAIDEATSSGFKLETLDLDGSGNYAGTWQASDVTSNWSSWPAGIAMTHDMAGKESVLQYGATNPFGIVEKYDATSLALTDASAPVDGPSGSVWLSTGQLATGHNGETYALRTDDTVADLNADLPLSFSGSGDPAWSLSATVQSDLITVYAAPEPAPFALLGLGVVGLVIRKRRR